MIRFLIPSFFTVAALLAGFLSLLKTSSGDYFHAAQLIMLSMVLDGFDGNLARWLHAESKFGADFDTFVDFLSFGVAPAFLAYECALREIGVAGLFLSAAMVLSGGMRLSRFRVIDPNRGQKGFLGLPITVNGGWVALWVLVVHAGVVDPEIYSLRHGLVAALVWGCSTAFVVLQMSHVHYPKPTKDVLFFIPSTFLILILFLKTNVAVASALAMAAFGPLYAFIVPFVAKHEVVIEVEDDDEEEPVSLR